MASVSRKRTRRQWKLERYSKFLIPIPLGFITPILISMLRDNATHPDPSIIFTLPFILAMLLVPAGVLQLIVGLPTIAALRGKSLLAHMFTGLALAIVMIVSQGFGDLLSEMAGSIDAAPPGKFRSSSTIDPIDSSTSSTVRFSGKDELLKENASVEEIFGQIMRFGVPMMFGYFLVWNIFTSMPNLIHEELTEERPERNQRPIRTLRGEELSRDRKVVTRRKRTRVRRSL